MRIPHTAGCLNAKKYRKIASFQYGVPNQLRPSSIKVPASYKDINWDKEIESCNSPTRCKVEHPFLIVKRQFGYAKVVYQGLAKNLNRFHILFALANMMMCARAGRTAEFWGIVRPFSWETGSGKSQRAENSHCSGNFQAPEKNIR